MRRDIDRTEIPGGSAYNMIDFIPDEIQAVTGGRGGWTYAGSAPTGGGSRIYAVGYHPDTGKLVAVDNLQKLWDVAAATQIGTLPTYLTLAPGALNPPAYHRGYLIFVNVGPATSGTPAYYKSDGSVGSLSGAPSAKFAGVYKDHALLANDSGIATSLVHPNRIWFSAAGDPTTWDTTFGWWDTTGPITGLASLTNAILIFHPNSTERLRGTTPPPGSDMVLEPLLPNVGCLDANSIAYWQNRAIFASSQGVYMTDGVTSVDLTASASLKTYWQSLMSGYDSSWRVAAGIYRDHYIVTISSNVGLGTFTDSLCFSLQTQAAWRFTNLCGSAFASVTNTQQEKLYMGQWNANRVAELSSLWSPSASVKQDGDGTNPTPIIETGMYRGYDRLHRRWIESMGKQKWRWAYVDYDLRDAATDNPTMTLSYCSTPTGSYTATDRTLPETTDISRVRRALSKTQGGATHSQMLGLKLAVNGPYASAKLLTLEGDFSPIDIGAL